MVLGDNYTHFGLIDRFIDFNVTEQWSGNRKRNFGRQDLKFIPSTKSIANVDSDKMCQMLLLALSHPLSKPCRVDIDFICIYEKNHDTESLSNIFHETVNMHIVETLGKLFKLSEITVSDFLNWEYTPRSN